MKIRLGNIECRFDQERYEIVKWYQNNYFGAEERMIEEGYKRVESNDGQFYFEKLHHTIHGSCFKNPESCYTIATLHYDKSEGCCDMRTVGPRLLELKKQDRKDYFKVYKIAEKNIKKESKN